MRYLFAALCLSLIVLGMSGTEQKVPNGQPASDKDAVPLILEKNEGEQRVRRPREVPVPSMGFMFKIDRLNGRFEAFSPRYRGNSARQDDSQTPPYGAG